MQNFPNPHFYTRVAAYRNQYSRGMHLDYCISRLALYNIWRRVQTRVVSSVLLGLYAWAHSKNTVHWNGNTPHGYQPLFVLVTLNVTEVHNSIRCGGKVFGKRYEGAILQHMSMISPLWLCQDNRCMKWLLMRNTYCHRAGDVCRYRYFRGHYSTPWFNLEGFLVYEWLTLSWNTIFLCNIIWKAWISLQFAYDFYQITWHIIPLQWK